jgi:hypothetical protein
MPKPTVSATPDPTSQLPVLPTCLLALLLFLLLLLLLLVILHRHRHLHLHLHLRLKKKKKAKRPLSMDNQENTSDDLEDEINFAAQYGLSEIDRSETSTLE